MLHCFTHSHIVDEYLGYLHSLMTVVNTVINRSEQVSVLDADLASFGCMCRHGIAGSYSNSDFRDF